MDARTALVHKLRAHLLPLLKRDLDAVVARTGVSREALRKLRTELGKPDVTGRLPSADALAVIITGYDWDLKRLLDPACSDPASQPVLTAIAGSVETFLTARAALILRDVTGSANDPDATELLRRSDFLLTAYDGAVRQLHAVARADRQRARAAALDDYCGAALARLGRDDAVWAATADAPALGRAASVYAARLREALRERHRDDATGDVRAGSFPVRASDPWPVVRDVGPAIERLLAPELAHGLGVWVGVAYEFTTAEVGTARAILRSHTLPSTAGRGSRRWEPDAVIGAYTRCLADRGYPPDLVQPTPPADAAPADVRDDGVLTAVMLGELFDPYCEAIGAAWDGLAGDFRVVGPGHGGFDGVLAPHPEEARLMIAPDEKLRSSVAARSWAERAGNAIM